MESFDGQRPGIVVETNETKGNDFDEHLSVTGSVADCFCTGFGRSIQTLGLLARSIEPLRGSVQVYALVLERSVPLFSVPLQVTTATSDAMSTTVHASTGG